LTKYVAIVEKLVFNGKHGDYAIANCKTLVGTVTFALFEPVWLEENVPEKGTYVVLSDIRKKRAGWRAMSARYVRPEDEQQLSK